MVGATVMKIVHIEGGLGNQMACFAVYVATQEANPGEEIYVDTFIYDIKEAHSTISMWNGYELERVFGLKLPDIRTKFTIEQTREQIQTMRESEFWNHNWSYDIAFIDMMSKYGYHLNNAYGNIGEPTKTQTGFNLNIEAVIKRIFRKFGSRAATNRFGYELKRFLHYLVSITYNSRGDYLLQKRDGDYFYNITLDFMKSNYLHKKIGMKVRGSLLFKIPMDEDNNRYLRIIKRSNSISIHVRRTDYLQFNEDCYKYGYFPKCVKFMKRHICDPVFFLFSDDLEWCKKHLLEIGLTPDDNIYYIDINTGKSSYRDMQLMASCKHNITTKSSFGWWASFLNSNPEKITCCQMGEYISTKQF